MKKLFLIGIPLVATGYCLLSVFTNFIGLGPLDTFPRTLQAVRCQDGVKAKVYRRKLFFDFLIGTDNRIEIKEGNRTIIEERLYWTDIWKDIEPEDLTLECSENKIRTAAQGYFDNTYQIESKNRIVIEKKYNW